MKKIIVGNWKMNPSGLAEAKRIFSEIKKFSAKAKKTKIVICPPFVFLPELQTTNYRSRRHKESGLRPKASELKTVHLGSQDLFWEKEGAFTGEISSLMLKDLGVEFVILGHSERRELGETDREVNLKIKTALDSGLTPVVCVGEKERDKDGEYLKFLKNQIKETLARIEKKKIKKIIVAYEPVWAISKGKKGSKALKGEEIYQMKIFIKKVLSDIFGRKDAEKIAIIYGGSSGPENTEDILVNGKVDGLLPGSNSLKPERLKEMIRIVDSL